MAQMGDFFDDFRRDQRVFMSEYSGGGNETLQDALAEAIFMDAMERNADVVKMASYAPLFANVNKEDWHPNLIYFNSSHAYGTPSYYNQLIFAVAPSGTVKGSLHTLRFNLTQPSSGTSAVLSPNLSASVTTATLTAAYSKTKQGANAVFIFKLANYGNSSQSLAITLTGLPPSTSFPTDGELTVLQSPSSDPLSGNSLEEPYAIIPKESAVQIESSQIVIQLPQYSVSVLRVFVAM